MPSITKLISLALLLALFASGEAKRFRNFHGGLNGGLKYHGFDLSKKSQAATPMWFQQKIDHFNPLSNGTFQQLYYVNSTFFVPGGPIFFLLGGESPLNPDAVGDHFILPVYAAKFGALIVAIEHRFYGQSFPASFDTANLTLLTSRQALEDYADFIPFIKQQYNATNSKVISFGGSYSGALSAWFRMKYPHFVDGSIATSGPIKAQLEFAEYFEVVQQSVGPACAARIRNVTTMVENMLTTTAGVQQLQQLFNTCSPIQTDLDQVTFLSSLTDGICEIVQYNMDNNAYTPFNIDKMCSTLLQGETEQEMLQSYISFNSLFNEFSGDNCTWTSYQGMIEQMQILDPSSPYASGRSWTWQTCIEFGYFQTGAALDQPFSSRISLDWFLQQCNDIFGVALTPDIDGTNAHYGSTDIEVTNTVFPNGSIDPWHILGLLDSNCEITSFMNGTAHCADLYPPRAADLPALTQTRALEVTLISKWLQDMC